MPFDQSRKKLFYAPLNWAEQRDWESQYLPCLLLGRSILVKHLCIFVWNGLVYKTTSFIGSALLINKASRPGLNPGLGVLQNFGQLGLSRPLLHPEHVLPPVADVTKLFIRRRMVVRFSVRRTFVEAGRQKLMLSSNFKCDRIHNCHSVPMCCAT